MKLIVRFYSVTFAILIFFLFFSCKEPRIFKYQVLIIGNEEAELEKDTTNLVENMLLSWNIPYQKILGGEIKEEIFLQNRTLKFTTVIISVDFKRFSDKEIGILKKISKKWGVSIISFFSFVDERSKELFGIRKISKEIIKSIGFEILKKEDFICEGFKEGEVFRGGEFLRLESNPGGIILKSKRNPIFFFHKYGKGVNYYFNFSPNGWLVFDGKQALFRRAIIKNSGNGFVYFDLEGVCVLRCDDPLRNISWEDDQSYQRFNYKRMEKRDWEELIKVLRKHDAGMSLAVVTGFKDDGEKERGELYAKGEKVEKRICGQIFDSKDVKYLFKIKYRRGAVLDYQKEFEGIKYALENYSNLDIQQHGFVHICPLDSWCKASDKHTDYTWGVEFYNLKERKDIPIEYQKIAIEEGYKRLVEWFGTEPVVFVPPGLFVSSNTSEILKEFGYRYYFDGFSFKKFQKEKYINLNFISVIPVKDLEWGVYPSYKRVFAYHPTILGLHDADFTYFGIKWFDKFLSDWKKEGVKKFISLGELVMILSSKIYAEYTGKKVSVTVSIPEPLSPKNSKPLKFFRNGETLMTLVIPDKWTKKAGKRRMGIDIPFKDNLSYSKIINF